MAIQNTSCNHIQVDEATVLRPKHCIIAVMKLIQVRKKLDQDSSKNVIHPVVNVKIADSHARLDIFLVQN